MSFNDSYLGTPPWDIGRPQRSIIELEESGFIKEDILDIGCGTGENALFLSQKGYNVFGFDSAENAIKKAKEKAKSRNLPVKFYIDDALNPTTDHKFSTIIDCGLFHTFNNTNLKIYIDNVFNLLEKDGYYHFLAFSDKEPGNWGPRRINKNIITKVFDNHWKIIEIKDIDFETNFEKSNVKGLRVTIMKN